MVLGMITGGVSALRMAPQIARNIKKIFASEYFYNKDGHAAFPKIVITDTTKTQYLFRINKGKENLSDSINAHMAEKNRPIPFDNMIYIGDGMTDVPSMALIKKEGGHAIAVYMNSQKEQIKTSKQLLKAKRVDFIAEADFRKSGELFRRTCLLLDYIISKIKYNFELEKCKKIK